ncbi:4-(cytidine 5'-diphospho)-2-C-methyl-D-erythritol kinase [Catellicoccus marimammalium]|uniref:4-diphosphocytidyl-2-C-methyl-D-erythritol kinase n=1 Tax=Catellicoccus marimammalium M35/04/3 TaxID=1234409 RepID=K8Z7P2_9ENTE|nr:4-(cytidine 5'-diphospho)-2-C-methyl-D-erythritol kinase [Catellicoccus marimammalium]EKU27009.1 4-diphosphocytidyl-2-C-methyl-D-erythritol kinase [Catellicoccus marimammalium M35/04/3]
MVEVKETAWGKINIALNIQGSRMDGYHDVQTVMTSVDLADHLSFSLREDGKIQLEMDNSFLPRDGRNYILQAATLLQETYGIVQGANISLYKKIPVSAGMGGGSSDAAATLRGLNRLWQINAPLEELARIGADIGSDVVYCLYSSTAYAEGIGNELTFLPKMPHCYLLLAKPAVSISTPKVFQALSLESLPICEVQKVREGIEMGDYAEICHYAGNDLEPVTTQLCPELLRIRKTLEKVGADAVFMSGTGPTMVGLFKKEQKAQRAMNALRGFCKEIYLTRPVHQRRNEDE